MGNIDLSILPKRERRRVKAAAFVKRLEIEAQLANAKAEMPLDLAVMTSTLDEIQSSLEEVDAVGKAKSAKDFKGAAVAKHGRTTLKMRSRTRRQGVDHFALVAAHPVFRDDPLAAIEGHVLATVKARKPTPRKGKTKSGMGKGKGKVQNTHRSASVKTARATPGSAPSSRRKNFGKSQRKRR